MKPIPPVLRSLGCCAVVGALAVVLLWPSIQTGQVLLPTEALTHQAPYHPTSETPRRAWNALQWDALAQYYPWRLFGQRWIRKGELPLWNPHQFCGMPFAGNAQSALFYPPNLLFWLSDVATAFGLLAVLRFLAAGSFTFLLARTVGMCRPAALFAGLAYAFCAFMVTWTTLPTLVDVAMWLPCVLWALELIFRGRPRFGVPCLALGLGMQFLAGHPHMSVYVLFAVLLRVAFGAAGSRCRQSVVGISWAGLGLVLGVCLGACQLLPTAELSRYSHRFHEGPRPAPLGRANPQALPYQHLALLVSPGLMGDANAGSYYGFAWSRGNYADYCGYTGVVTLVLAALGLAAFQRRTTGFWLAVAGLGFLLALNPYPLAWLMARNGVTAATLGSPTRALVLMSLGVAMLGGWGVEALGRREDRRTRRDVTVVVVWALALFAALIILKALINATLSAVSGSALAYALPVQTMAVIGAGTLLFLTCLFAVAALTGRVSLRGGQALLVAMLCLDLLWFGHGYNPAGRREEVYPAAPSLTWLQQHAVGDRVMTLNRQWSLTQYPQGCLPPNGAMVFGLDDIGGYDSLHLARYRTLAAELQQGNPSPPENGNMVLLDNYASPLVRLLGVGHVMSREALHANPSLLRSSEGGAFVYKSPEAFPRAFLSDSAHAGGANTGVECSYSRPGPNRATVTGSGPMLGELVTTDTYFPGWRASANGQPLQVRPGLSLFREVTAANGTTRVDFAYWPQSVRLGLFLALTALGCVVCLSVRGALRASR